MVMRVLGRLRLSRLTDESTSITRQREIIEQWASANDHTVVGWAEDVDVSGSVDPFETPSLGAWLNERTEEWDVLVAWKLDRLGRDAIRLNKLIAWCQEHGKSMVSCTEGIDIGTPVGRLIANVIAFLAEGELEAIRERVRGSKRKLREVGRWGGGKPPYGYVAVKRPEGGFQLEIDPLSSSIVRAIVLDVIDGKPMAKIVDCLNNAGVLTPGEYHATVRAGKPQLRGDAPGKWAPTPIRNMLRSKALRGYAHHQGETVRDGAGMPVVMAEPLVDLDEWELIQSALDAVQASRAGVRAVERSMLSGLVFCHECGSGLHHNRTVSRGHEYRYFRCKNKDTAPIPADDLEQVVEETFLLRRGGREARDRVWVVGDEKESELREAVTALEELSKAAGRAQSKTAKDRLQAQLDALDGKIAELEAAPAKEARWEYRSSGITYGSAWESSESAEEKRELLRKWGITVAASISGVEGNRSAVNAGSWRLDLRIPEEETE